MKSFFAFGLAVAASLILSGCNSLSPGLTMQTKQYAGYQTIQDPCLGEVPVIEITPCMLSCDSECSVENQTSVFVNAASDGWYRVQAGDRLSIHIWGEPEFNIPGTQYSGEQILYDVMSNGTVYFPYVGAISVSNKHIEEIRVELTNKLKDLFNEPTVSVAVAEYRSQSVNVIGEVNAPIRIQLTDVKLLLPDAISQSGGVTPLGDLRAVQLQRGRIVEEFNLVPAESCFLAQDVRLLDGDIVYVPSRVNKEVYVFGEVGLPHAIMMDSDTMSLSAALARCLGFDRFSSNPSLVYVFRTENNGEKVAYHLNCKSPAALMLASDFKLKRQDVIYVGTYKPALLNRIITNFLPLTRAAADLTRSAAYINDVINRYGTYYDDVGSN